MKIPILITLLDMVWLYNAYKNNNIDAIILNIALVILFWVVLTKYDNYKKESEKLWKIKKGSENEKWKK